MNSSKKSFILFLDSLDILDELNDKETANLFRAIRANQRGEEFELTKMERVAFTPIKNSLDREMEKWEAEVEKRREAGRLGGIESGKVRRERAKQNEANEASAIKTKQNEANEADNVSVNVPVIDTDTNISKDIGVETPTYGNDEINRLIEGVNKNLPYKLPDDNRARMVAYNMLQLLEKKGGGKIKKGREFLKDDKFENAKWFLGDYIRARVSKGYGAESWYKLKDSLKLWLVNEGKFPK